MKSQSSSAEETAAFLLSKQSSSPVMIPGAFEKHASASTGPGGYSTGMQVADRAVAVSARERLVYEREGGGAPSERSAGASTTILQKLWRRA